MKPVFRLRRTRLALVLLLSRRAAAAHDIPASVVVQAFVRPQGDTLRVLVRVPLAAMRDVEFPLTRRRPARHRRAPTRPSATRRRCGSRATSRSTKRTRALGAPRMAAVRVSLPSDRSFATFETGAGARHRAAAAARDTTIIWNQALLDVLFEYPIRSDRSRVLDPAGPRAPRPPRRHGAALPAAGRRGTRVRVPAIRDCVRLDPRWHQAAWRFVTLGFAHILDGTDHLLFLFCLVIPFRRFGALVLIVTAFTVAHSITLIAAASGLAPDALWFPPLVEMLIAASILYMALENIVGATSVQRRWMIAFAFGLVHGFGFSFALRETLQFAGSHW